MESEHKIQVYPEPDLEMKKTPYFWVVLSWSGNDWYNNGCGWSSSPEQAFLDGMKHYNQLVDKYYED